MSVRQATVFLLLVACHGTAVRSPQRPEDPSLSVDDYVARGVPEPGHVWSTAELAQAGTALEQLAAEQPGALPRKDSAESGPVFARLVSVERLPELRDRRRPLEERVQAFDHVETLARILRLYAAAYGRGHVRDTDAVELFIAVVRWQSLVPQLIDELMATIDPDGASYPKAMQGLGQVRDGMGQMVAGTLIALSDATLDVGERTRLARVMVEELPRVWPMLRDEARAQLRDTITALIAKTDDTSLRRELDRLAAIAR